MKRKGGQLPHREKGSAGKASQYFYTIFLAAVVVWCLALIPGLGSTSAKHHGGLFPVRARPAVQSTLARFAALYDAIGGSGGAATDGSITESGAVSAAAVSPSSGDTVARPASAAPSSNPYEGAAIVTLAGGDTSGKHAIALIQSLRDVGTVLPIVVLLARGGLGSATCHNNTWRRINNRDHIECRGPDTIADEIVSTKYLDVLRALKADIRVIPWIPRTQYTEKIPGGKESFWGYSLNRLVIFNMTEYKKIIYIDTDTMALKNIDHLALEPSFTAAWTHSCCNMNDLPRISGGLWIVEPDRRVGEYMWKLMVEGQPTLFANGTIDESVPRRTWEQSDMDLAMFTFRDWDWRNYPGFFPKVADKRHGYVKGLKLLPHYANMDNETFLDKIRDSVTGEQLKEGFRPELYDPTKGGGVLGRGVPGVVWHCLDVRYDQCIGNVCECFGVRGRDIPDLFYSVHFSCMQYVEKPGDYQSERDLQFAVYSHAMGCTRHYYVQWYDKLVRAGHRLPPPYWTGPPIPGHNETHDALVKVWRVENKVIPPMG